jgi:hypothetical protein
MRTGGLSAQDYVEIQNLYAGYNLASDAGDAEAYASCFTEHGVLEIEPLGVTIRGRTDLAMFKQRDREGRGGRYRRHWNGSLHLESIDVDTVRGRCYLQAFNGIPGQLPVLSDCGVYEDLLVRVDGVWKFARRRLTMDGSTWSAPSSR